MWLLIILLLFLVFSIFMFVRSSNTKNNQNKRDTVKINIFGKEYDTGATKEDIEKYEKYIENISYDNNWLDKEKRLTIAEREQVGFSGFKLYSENGIYCVVYTNDDESNFNVGLIDVKNKIILYRKKVCRAHRCLVSNNGTVLCEDWGNYKTNANYVLVFDITGQIKLKKRHNGAIGDYFSINNDGSEITYNLNYSGKLIKINL